jgi:hypothetical protein
MQQFGDKQGATMEIESLIICLMVGHQWVDRYVTGFLPQRGTFYTAEEPRERRCSRCGKTA